METLKVIKTNAEVAELIEYLQDKEFISVDTETTGLGTDALIIGYSVCAEPELAWYVITARWDVSSQTVIELETKETAPEVMRLLKTKSLIMHNGVFDCNMINLNYKVSLIGSLHTDTMILAHILDENRKVGLKDLGAKRFGASAKKEQEEMHASVNKNGGVLTKKCYELYKADPELIGKYGAKDTILTYNLFYELVPELYAEGLDKFFYEDESMPLLRGPTYELNTTGLKVDMSRLLTLKKELEVEILELKAYIHHEIAPHVSEKYPGTKEKNTFNIGSGAQLSWLLFSKLGNMFPKLGDAGRELAQSLGQKTPYSNKAKEEFKAEVIARKGTIWREKGKVWDKKARKYKGEGKVADWWTYCSTDKTVLAEFSRKYRWVEKLVTYKKLTKLLSTYVEGIERLASYGVIRPSFLQHGTTSGRYSSRHPNFQNLPRDDKRVKSCIVARPDRVFVGADYCLHPDSELLTPNGWKNVMTLTGSDKVWQVEPQTLAGSFVHPQRVINREYSGNMHSIGNSRGKLVVTENHTMLYAGQNHPSRKDKPLKRKVNLSQQGIPAGNMGLIPYSTSNTVSQHTCEEIWKACAIQADGSIVNTANTYRIQVSYPRKRSKLTELFGPGRPAGYIREGHTLETESWRVKFQSELLTGTKSLNFSTLGSEHADIVVEALTFWDGSRRKDTPNRTTYYSTDVKSIDSAQSYLVRSGWEASRSGPNKLGLYSLTMRKNARVRLRPAYDHSITQYQGKVGCVTVPSGFILVRYDGFVAVTGNCQLEPRVFASFSKDQRLMDCFKSGEDFYSVIGVEVFEKYGCSLKKDEPGSFAKKHPELRQISKVVALSATYGTTAPKMATAIGKTKEEAQEVIDSYFSKFPDVQKLMLEAHNQAKTSGVVHNLFGRPRRMPKAIEIGETYGNTKHSDLPYEARNLLNLSINHRIQSTGASIMNRASILFWQSAQDLGWKDVKIVLQVHDSLVIECPEAQAEAVSHLLRVSMETAVTLPGVDLVADPKIGNNLAEV